MRGCSSQENEIRSMSENREDNNLTRQMDVLTNEVNLRISRVMDSLFNGVNSQIENAISMVISEKVIHQVQNVFEAVLARQSERVPTVYMRPHNSGNDVQNCDEDNMTNRDFQSHQTSTELYEGSPYLVTGAFEPQTSIPEFLTGRIHTQPTLCRQESTNYIWHFFDNF